MPDDLAEPLDTLARIDARRDAYLARLRLSKASRRVHLYLDVRAGEVVSGGVLKEEPWESRWD